jgi:hypothetical protein
MPGPYEQEGYVPYTPRVRRRPLHPLVLVGKGILLCIFLIVAVFFCHMLYYKWRARHGRDEDDDENPFNDNYAEVQAVKNDKDPAIVEEILQKSAEQETESKARQRRFRKVEGREKSEKNEHQRALIDE